MPAACARHRAGGLTLVEVAVSCAVLLILTSAFFGAFWAARGYRTWAEDRVDAARSARAAVDRMVRELRLARSFALADRTQVEFTADLGAGSVSIRYYFYDPGGDNRPPFYLYRAVGYGALGDGQPLAVLVAADVGARGTAPPTPRVDFAYRDAAGATLSRPLSAADRARVALVSITVTCENIEDVTAPPVPHARSVVRSAVGVRNLP